MLFPHCCLSHNCGNNRAEKLKPLIGMDKLLGMRVAAREFVRDFDTRSGQLPKPVSFAANVN
jgi:hypothetical protein